MEQTHVMILLAIAVLLVWKHYARRETFEQIRLQTSQQFDDTITKYGPPQNVSMDVPVSISPTYPKLGLVIAAKGKRCITRA